MQAKSEIEKAMAELVGSRSPSMSPPSDCEPYLYEFYLRPVGIYRIASNSPGEFAMNFRCVLSNYIKRFLSCEDPSAEVLGFLAAPGISGFDLGDVRLLGRVMSDFAFSTLEGLLHGASPISGLYMDGGDAGMSTVVIVLPKESVVVFYWADD